MAKKQLMKNFQRPTETVLDYDESDRTFARFVAYPYERGFGTSIGNALRRILLSSIEGYAITAIRVSYTEGEGEGANSKMLMSEFEAITHVAEDTVEIIANLKNCYLSLEGDVERETFTFDIKGESVVTAAIFEQHTNINIYNPEQVLFHAMKPANLTLEVQIEKGAGYRAAEEGKKLLDVVDAIAIDALFSPVLQVMLKVEKMRVGRRTDYDKLTLEVRTNGAVRPQDAVGEAAKIAKEHYTLFINFDEDDVEIADYRNVYDDFAQRTLSSPIETLELSARASNCLVANNIRTLGELISHGEAQIAEMRNFGKKSLEEIKNKLAEEWNLRLGMTDPDDIRNALSVKNT